MAPCLRPAQGTTSKDSQLNLRRVSAFRVSIPTIFVTPWRRTSGRGGCLSRTGGRFRNRGFHESKLQLRKKSRQLFQVTISFLADLSRGRHFARLAKANLCWQIILAKRRKSFCQCPCCALANMSSKLGLCSESIGCLASRLLILSPEIQASCPGTTWVIHLHEHPSPWRQA
jgi:hypothetical protein